MMDIHRATRRYEAWSERFTTPVAEDLEAKHAAMAESPFAFFRATYYRWTQHWLRHKTMPVFDARTVLGIGDVHIENFGTWRDAEGRLNWGINDFDEAAKLPYTADLVRLMVSARMAKLGGGVALETREIIASVIAGYMASLASGGTAFVLAENHAWLRKLAQNKLRDPARYWRKLERLDDVSETVPRNLRNRLRASLPRGTKDTRVVHRRAGLGSLGRPRWAMVGRLSESHVAREIKARVPSAWYWAGQTSPSPRDPLPSIWRDAVRSQDPYMDASTRWVLRRLGPDGSRIALSDLPKEKHEKELLYAMGQEIGNVHLGSADPRRILDELDARQARRFAGPVNRMADGVMEDYERWKSG